MIFTQGIRDQGDCDRSSSLKSGEKPTEKIRDSLKMLSTVLERGNTPLGK
ncbi:hypothetical protein [Phormidesmis priestleyi]|nr:hypothetical protein [Phormidesmis priestleyi]